MEIKQAVNLLWEAVILINEASKLINYILIYHKKIFNFHEINIKKIIQKHFYDFMVK